MSHTIKKLENSEVEISIVVTPGEYAKHLEAAAKRLSERAAIKGFRKGKVPTDVLKKEFGEIGILQEALETIVEESFYRATTEAKLNTVGMPKISINKFAPGNDIEYKATVATLPAVTLPDISTIKVERKAKAVDEKDVTDTLDALRGMRANEVEKESTAAEKDKLVIDMDMSIDNVPVEGGQAKDYQVYLSEPHYIPGFNEQVAGLKKGDEKSFTLDFPSTHYQKHLAGKKVDFKIKVKGVFDRQLPELSDEFAQKLGQENAAKLKEIVRSNLETEAKEKADRQYEIELLEKLIEKTTFETIPAVLIDAERQRMFFELKSDLEKNHIAIEDYLRDIKKNEEEMLKGFTKQAEKRAQAALLSRQIASENHLHVCAEEVDAEIQMMKVYYKKDKDYLANLDRPEVRDSIASVLQNRKVMNWIKAKVEGKEYTDPHAHNHDHAHDHSDNHDHNH